MKRLLLAAAALAISTPAAAQQWIGVWGAPPAPPTPQSRSFENQTVRQVLHLSRIGPQIRIRFTNEYGETPLRIGAATVSVAAGAPIPVTFAGKRDVTIPAGAPLYSDPIDLRALPAGVTDITDITVSTFFPAATGPCSCHPQATATAQVFAGDVTASNGGAPASTYAQRAFVSRVDAAGLPNGRTIVAFGDSITDGTRSTNDINSRWPDLIAMRLRMGADGNRNTGIVNAAISGNQVLATGRPVFGEGALVRFDRDVLSVPNVTHMTLLEGINDFGMNTNPRPTAEQVIAGYQQIIARAHAHGIKVIAGTLLPYEGAAYFSEEGEARRQQVNTWIRTSGAFDGVIDFDAVMKDPANPRRLKAIKQSGDWLHPNDAGYLDMAAAIDLNLFR